MPSWFLFGFSSSLCSALAMHSHQRLRGPSAASAVWVKIIAVMVAAPVLIHTGLPTQPIFYAYTALAALLWCVNDLTYFRAVGQHGAALLARLAPLGILLSFVAWFAVKPGLLDAYLHDLPRFAGICAILLFAVFCAFEAHRCPASSKALRAIWIVILIAVAGTFAVKSALDAAPQAKGVFGYVGIEAACMLFFYAFYFGWKNRSAGAEIFSRKGIASGMIVGSLLVAGIVLRTYAQQRVDHPAYVSMIGMLDIVWLMILSRLSGWKDDSNKWAGLGIVFAALALAALKIS